MAGENSRNNPEPGVDQADRVMEGVRLLFRAIDREGPYDQEEIVQNTIACHEYMMKLTSSELDEVFKEVSDRKNLPDE